MAKNKVKSTGSFLRHDQIYLTGLILGIVMGVLIVLAFADITYTYVGYTLADLKNLSVDIVGKTLQVIFNLVPAIVIGTSILLGLLLLIKFNKRKED